jgi:hypothetical protein
MANVQHADLTDPYLHEPIGIAAASANTVYAADGAGSGTWQKVDSDVLDTASIYTFIEDGIEAQAFDVVGTWYTAVTMADVSTASFVLVPVLKNCTLTRVRFVLANAITVASSTITVRDSTGASMGTQVITQAASAEGTGFTFTPAVNNVLTGPTYVKIETDGASTTTAILYILCEFEGFLNG